MREEAGIDMEVIPVVEPSMIIKTNIIRVIEIIEVRTITIEVEIVRVMIEDCISRKDRDLRVRSEKRVLRKSPLSQ